MSGRGPEHSEARAEQPAEDELDVDAGTERDIDDPGGVEPQTIHLAEINAETSSEKLDLIAEKLGGRWRQAFDEMRAKGETEYLMPSPEDNADGKEAFLWLALLDSETENARLIWRLKLVEIPADGNYTATYEKRGSDYGYISEDIEGNQVWKSLREVLTNEQLEAYEEMIANNATEYRVPQPENDTDTELAYWVTDMSGTSRMVMEPKEKEEEEDNTDGMDMSGDGLDTTAGFSDYGSTDLNLTPASAITSELPDSRSNTLKTPETPAYLSSSEGKISTQTTPETPAPATFWDIPLETTAIMDVPTSAEPDIYRPYADLTEQAIKTPVYAELSARPPITPTIKNVFETQPSAIVPISVEQKASTSNNEPTQPMGPENSVPQPAAPKPSEQAPIPSKTTIKTPENYIVSQIDAAETPTTEEPKEATIQIQAISPKPVQTASEAIAPKPERPIQPPSQPEGGGGVQAPQEQTSTRTENSPVEVTADTVPEAVAEATSTEQPAEITAESPAEETSKEVAETAEETTEAPAQTIMQNTTVQIRQTVKTTVKQQSVQPVATVSEAATPAPAEQAAPQIMEPRAETSPVQEAAQIVAESAPVMEHAQATAPEAAHAAAKPKTTHITAETHASETPRAADPEKSRAEQPMIVKRQEQKATQVHNIAEVSRPRATEVQTTKPAAHTEARHVAKTQEAPITATKQTTTPAVRAQTFQAPESAFDDWASDFGRAPAMSGPNAQNAAAPSQSFRNAETSHAAPNAYAATDDDALDISISFDEPSERRKTTTRGKRKRAEVTA
ncbi:MAG: hypothetical protein JWN01_769 [Patescibacteria group bacterium]|nr:hypothetical protein [Patescibacteria group bacterium]